MAEKTMGQPESEGPRIKMDQARVGGRDARDTIPGIDRPFPDRTAPKDLPEPGRKKGKGIGKGVRNALIAATALTTLGGAGYVTYQEVPAVHRSIDRWLNGVPIEEKFPNKIDLANIEIVPEDELIAKYINSNPINIEGKKITLLFLADSETITNSPDLRYNKTLNYLLPGGVNPEVVKDVTHNNIKINGLPENRTLYFPIDGSIFLGWQAGEKEGEGRGTFTSSYTYLRIVGRDSKGNQYEIGISVLGGKPLTDFAPLPQNVHPVPEMGTKIKAGQPMIKLPENFSEARKVGQALPGEEGQVMISGFIWTDKGPIPINLDFLSSLSNNTFVSEKNTAK